MGIIYALIIGLVVGGLAKLVMPGRDPGGLVITALLGVGGSILALVLGRAAGWYTDASSGPGIIASIVGALILLAGYRLFVGRRA